MNKNNPIGFSLFASARDNQPRPNALSIHDFVQAHFSHHAERREKGGQAWSPTIYAEGAARSAKGVTAVTALVIDVDDGTPVEYFRGRLAGHFHLIHSSHSHTAEHPKFRVIVFLANPVPVGTWATVWQRLSLWVDGHIDPATKDASRIYFLPSKPPSAEGHFIEVHEGEFLDIETLPELPPSVLPQGPRRSEVRPQQTPILFKEDMFQQPGLEALVDRCHLIRESSHPENQPHVPEPFWRVMLSNLSRVKGGHEYAHRASEHHPDYSEEETDRRLLRHFEEAGPLTCAYAKEMGWKCPRSGGCQGIHGSPVTSPIELARWDAAEAAKLPQTVVAQAFIDRHFPGGLVYVNEKFLGYEAGIYKVLDERSSFRKLMIEFLGKAASTSLVKNLFTLLQDFVSVSGDAFLRNPHLVCVRNGTLDLRAGSLLRHSPDHMLRNRLDVDWDPNAQCPRFLAFLDSVFQHDADKSVKIAFLQQWMGYLLVPDTSQQKMLWLVGAGGNGKSVLLQTIEWLIGDLNLSHAMLDRLDQPIVRAELEGKTVNISADLPMDAMLNDGYIKAIVAGDVIEAERKYKPSFSFKPVVRLMAAMNNLPRTNDTTDGFFRRTVILTFNRRFAEHEQNPNLAGELREELAGILAWAVRGLNILREQGRFTIPASSNVALSVYRTESNPVKLFADECLMATQSGKGITARDLFSVFQTWCRERGFKERNIITFGKALAELGYEKRKSGKEYWRVEPSEGGSMLFMFADTVVVPQEGGT